MTKEEQLTDEMRERVPLFSRISQQRQSRQKERKATQQESHDDVLHGNQTISSAYPSIAHPKSLQRGVAGENKLTIVVPI